jgi:hypothetical protein
MPRQRRTTVYNMLTVPTGFVTLKGEYLGTITVVGLDEPAKKLAFYPQRYRDGKARPGVVPRILDYNKAKQYLLDGTLPSK